MDAIRMGAALVTMADSVKVYPRKTNAAPSAVSQGRTESINRHEMSVVSYPSVIAP
jgi:hypothetical protein